jgi:hypothetical protein
VKILGRLSVCWKVKELLIEPRVGARRNTIFLLTGSHDPLSSHSGNVAIQLTAIFKIYGPSDSQIQKHISSSNFLSQYLIFFAADEKKNWSI